ncbi:nucleoporin nup189 [Rhodotorula toruloides]|uniref:Nucleoporin nup189 n=1 Tax=Rhodotorula toruloides TaxID=5286 RepID=A0A511KL39_RHOTO|nr:nucleoporin nup189 [Rhodotorula toruloides]
MARFGLLSDSEDSSDGERSHTSTRRRSSSSPASSPSNSHNGKRAHDEDRSDDEEEDEAFDEEDAPPRSSLHHDHDLDSASDGEGLSSMGDEDEDADMSATASYDSRSQRSRTRSHSRQPDDHRSFDSHTPPLRASSRRALIPARRELSSTPAARAAQKKLFVGTMSTPARMSGLEPKRIAVMQASFFGQAGDAFSQTYGEGGEDEDEREETQERLREEREKKRRTVQAGLAARSQPVPAPQDVPTPAVDPLPFRPLRPVTLVPFDSSITASRTSSLADAGLALSRSFRVGLGPSTSERGGEKIVSLRGVYEVAEGGKLDVTIERINSLSNSPDASSALRLLELQLAQTDIYEPETPYSAPQAVPSSSLRFGDFVDLFTSDASGTTLDEAELFKLGQCLFDEISDLDLPEIGDDGEPVDPAYRAYVLSIRRRALLSSWLSRAASSSASQLATSSSPLDRIFHHLSTHNVSAACDVALESHNLHLATLLSQLGSTVDDSFKEDLYLQLQKWREYGVDEFVEKGYRRIVEVMSGNLGVSEGRAQKGGDAAVEEMHVLEGLSWKAAVGMWLWYGILDDSAAGSDEGASVVANALRRYEEAYVSDSRVSAPLPSHISSASGAPTPGTLDPTYHLLQLFSSPTHSLELALSPLNFGPAKMDYRLPWHLYVLFSRVLRRRDFEDRLEVDLGSDDVMGEDGEDAKEGNSVTADRVTESYAAQLESLGKWEWGAFVLLHLELEECRANAIKNLLTRHVDDLEDPAVGENGKVKFLVETLKIPQVWIYSALADRTLSLPVSKHPHAPFRAYTLLLAAQRTPEAHRLATEQLVPEAIIRNDPGLVRRLLDPFLLDSQDDDDDALAGSVEGWSEGGRVYLLYLLTLDQASIALSSASSASTSSFAPLLSRTIAAVQAFSRGVAETARTKGNRKLRLAVGEMESRLLVLVKAAGGTALEKTQPSLLTASDRSVWIQGANKAFREKGLAKAGGAVKA